MGFEDPGGGRGRWTEEGVGKQRQGTGEGQLVEQSAHQGQGSQPQRPASPGSAPPPLISPPNQPWMGDCAIHLQSKQNRQTMNSRRS